MALFKADWPSPKVLHARLQGAKNELADSFFGVLIQFSRTQARSRRAGGGEALTLHCFGQRRANQLRLAFALRCECFVLAWLRLLPRRSPSVP